jgi:tRNA(Ile)-lysidine synthase
VRIAVGFSGGLDSTVLLHLLARHAPDHGLSVLAFHAHHGLQPAADAWLAHCAAYAAVLGLPFQSARLTIDPRAPEGVEAAARAARYAAFASLDVDIVALAHHCEDQAETMMLRLLRGTGSRGAAAMSPWRPLRDAVQLWRPLLEVPRSTLRAYADTQGLPWVEDPSNQSLDLNRNYLRRVVFPRLSERFPAAARTLARSATQFAEDAWLLSELAVLDGGTLEAPLSLVRLAALSPARQRNLLRAWLGVRHVQLSASRLEALRTQMLTAAPDRLPALVLASGAVRRYRDQLHWVPAAVDGAPCPLLPVPVIADVPVALPGWGGRFFWQPGTGGGIDPIWLAKLELRTVTEGARLQLRHGGPTRPLKHLFQESGIPPWQRRRWPMLWHGEVLVACPGIGVAPSYQSAAGWWPQWIPDDATLPDQGAGA